MTQDVMYTTRWNSTTRDVVPGFPWLTEQDARRLYASLELVQIVDARERDEAGNPRARWLITKSGRKFRVTFFDEHGTEWREIDYDDIDGRLWMWIVVQYDYPDDDRHYRLDEASTIVTTERRPDGTGSIGIRDVASRSRDITEFSDITDNDDNWLDPPEFGDWTRITDPDYTAASYRTDS